MSKNNTYDEQKSAAPSHDKNDSNIVFDGIFSDNENSIWKTSSAQSANAQKAQDRKANSSILSKNTNSAVQPKDTATTQDITETKQKPRSFTPFDKPNNFWDSTSFTPVPEVQAKTSDAVVSELPSKVEPKLTNQDSEKAEQKLTLKNTNVAPATTVASKKNLVLAATKPEGESKSGTEINKNLSATTPVKQEPSIDMQPSDPAPVASVESVATVSTAAPVAPVAPVASVVSVDKPNLQAKVESKIQAKIKSDTKTIAQALNEADAKIAAKVQDTTKPTLLPALKKSNEVANKAPKVAQFINKPKQESASTQNYNADSELRKNTISVAKQDVQATVLNAQDEAQSTVISDTSMTKATKTPLVAEQDTKVRAQTGAEQMASPQRPIPQGAPPDQPQDNFAQLAPAEVDFIPPLLRSLSTLLRLRGKTISAQFLYAGLAGVGEVTPGECMRAAARAGLQARIMPRATIEDISPMTLPCILLLQGGKSCVLTTYTRQVATVIFPESGEEPQQVSTESLVKEYTGYAAFGSVEKKSDKRIDTFRQESGKRWFWDAIKHYGPIYRHAAFASIIINLIALGSPLFVMNVYDRVVPNHALETLWVLALGVTLAYLFDFLLRTLRNYFVDTAGRNADVVISSMLVDKVLTMQLDHKPESTGALVNNVREFESLREFFSSSTLLSCIDLPFLVLFLLCLSFIGGPLVLLPIIAMPVMFGAGFLLQSLAKRAAEKSYAQSMHKNALLTEMVNGLETLKCCQGENRMQRVWETVVENSAQANAETKKYGSLAVGFSVFITQFVTVGMVVWGVYLIADGTLTMGGLIGSNILAGRAMAPLMQLAGLITRFQNSRISLDALNVLMALPSEDRQSQATVDFGPLESSFTFENVSFAYPNAQRTAVENISLNIAPGEKVGIIGRMGSGKSTLIRLLIGLYQPKDGAVKFGGVDIRQLAGADLRSRVGFAPQDTVLFYGSIRDNIVLGDPSVNDLRTIRAANLSGAIEFVRANPEGFGAQVGEQGKALSGGQRQAIGLARALVRDPEVLILDEPTSNMDTSSEQAVQARLTKIVQNKTLILITHRMSMLKMVDRLIVMEAGRIVADGPKDIVIQKLRASSPAAAKKSAAGSTGAEAQQSGADNILKTKTA